MKRVGILGGTFDPPHLGHVSIAQASQQAYGLDEIWLMPAANPPHKNDELSSIEDRLAMLQVLLQDYPDININKIELERAGQSYTYDTIILLREQHPQTKFYFIVGADVLKNFDSWHRVSELTDLVTFILVARPGYCLEDLDSIKDLFSPPAWTEFQQHIITNTAQNISSTAIRRQHKTGKNIVATTGAPVAHYIQEHGLYQ